MCNYARYIAFKFLAINFHKICLALHICTSTPKGLYEKRVYNFIIYTHTE